MLDIFLKRKNPFIRKGSALLMQFLKHFCAKINPDLPIILVNSFPKSGTHLLIQIIEALPNINNFGTFIVSQPTLSFRERPVKKIVKKIDNLVSGEVASGHLFYKTEFLKKLQSKNVIHLFIYRDPRDVCVSEAHYLTYMNRWHRLHPYFKSLSNDENRVLFSITGNNDSSFPYYYPHIGQRFKDQSGWLTAPNVFSVKFEDIIGTNRSKTIMKIIKFYKTQSGSDVDIEVLIAKAIKHINPHKSHTFREGKKAGWRKAFKIEHKELFKKSAGQLLIELGYEQDLEW